MTDDVVISSYEPCVQFEGEGVCEACGWLDVDHALVLRLRATPSSSSRPSSPSSQAA